MICQACGAVIDKEVDKCPLCGNKIDKIELFRGYIEKGNAAYEAGDSNKAIMFYKNALEHGDVSEETYIKIGLAHEKNGDMKSARDMYFKALTINFENDNAHNLLIGIYGKLNKLGDLRNWYQSSMSKFPENTVNRYIKIIGNIINFKSQPPVKIEIKDDGIKSDLLKGIKSYMIFNLVIGAATLLLGAGFVGYYVFKINIAYIITFTSVFFAVSLGVLFYYKIRNINKKKANQPDIEDLLKDVKEK